MAPSGGYAGQTAATTDKAVTLNDRLNKALGALQYQCDRIESVLSRVNGTPQKIESAAKTPHAMMSMQNTVDNLESTVQRLVDLTCGVEHIA